MLTDSCMLEVSAVPCLGYMGGNFKKITVTSFFQVPRFLYSLLPSTFQSLPSFVVFYPGCLSCKKEDLQVTKLLHFGGTGGPSVICNFNPLILIYTFH